MDCLPRISITQSLRPLNSRVLAVLSPLTPPRFLLSRPSFNPSCSSSPFHLYPPFLGFHSKLPKRSGRRHATNPGSPSPESDPPPGNGPNSTLGLETTFLKVQDRVQIFFAVLFWMSLFFWASAGDGRNNGRPNKGSQFRR